MTCNCSAFKMKLMHIITETNNSDLYIDTGSSQNNHIFHRLRNRQKEETISIKDFIDTATALANCPEYLEVHKNNNTTEQTTRYIAPITQLKMNLSPNRLIQITKKIDELLGNYRDTRKEGFGWKIRDLFEKTAFGRESIKNELDPLLLNLQVKLSTLAADIVDARNISQQALSALAIPLPQEDNKEATLREAAQNTQPRTSSNGSPMAYTPPSTENKP